MTAVGTWAWAQMTDGRLRRRDRAELLRQGVVARLSSAPGDWRSRLLGESRALRLPEPPDSKLAREAEELVRELSSPALYGHCLRTWAFAALFAVRDSVAHDAELLYLACVLHDLGLTHAHDGGEAAAGCFAVEGARAAAALMCRLAVAEERAHTVAEAISLHLNITVPARLGAEAHLLSKGVTLDVVGRRRRQIPAAATSAVNERWPRAGAADELTRLTRRQAEIRPQSRAALLHQLGFAGLISGNPLERAGR